MSRPAVEGPPADQLTLIRDTARRARPKPPDPPAAADPVARVVVDVPLAHLDRPFDYAVTQRQSAAAVPGVRVRVRFAGRLVGGYLLERAAASEHVGRLARLRVVSPEPVLTPHVARLARLVADRYAGTLADVVRLAVPPRHATAEAAAPPIGPGDPRAEPIGPGDPRPEPMGPGAPRHVAGTGRPSPRPDARPGAAPEPGPWAAVGGGPAFLAALAAGGSPRGVWQVPPGAGTEGTDWPDALARAALATLAGGRGALLVVPDLRDAERVDAALRARAGPGRHVLLSADLGPAERYRRWLAVLRGGVRVVVGTRAAAFAPVSGLGLVAIWDDGDDLHAEPRAPYPHAREVLLLRAHDTGCAALLGGHARTAEAQQLVESGWAVALQAPRADVRRRAPYVRPADTEPSRDGPAGAARLPPLAWRTARDGLRQGPVLVQVPRGGYLPVLSCGRCREPARCTHCRGPLALAAGHDAPACTWCGRAPAAWTCPHCGDTHLRAARTGSLRTAEELGRAFPGTPVRTSGGDAVERTVPADPALVVATPGAEPVAEDGYAAALLLDGPVLLQRPALRAMEETLRRWLAAAALVRPRELGGRVVVVAPADAFPVQALVRWDPAGAAERELAQRREAAFPPAVRLAELRGHAADVADLLAAARLPPGSDVLGPVPAAPPQDAAGEPGPALVRALVRARGGSGAALSRALQEGQRVRSARRSGEHVRVRIDPVDLG